MILGKHIEQRIQEVGITKAEFARRLGTSRQNVNTLIQKDSMNTDVLVKIGEILRHDFFQYIDRPYKEGPQNRRRVLLILEIDDNDDLSNLNDYAVTNI